MLSPSTQPFSFASVCSFTSRDGFAKDQAAPSAEGAHTTAQPQGLAFDLLFRALRKKDPATLRAARFVHLLQQPREKAMH